MEYKSLIVDTSFLVSYFLPKDSNYSRALRLLAKIKEFEQLLITNYIYSEFSTVVSQRLGKSGFLEVLNEPPLVNCKELIFNKSSHSKTKTEFRHITNKNTSFTDLSTFIIAKEYTIDSVLSFDKHFKYLAKEYKIDLIN